MKKTKLHQVDALDLQILEQLQKNGRLANSQLATSVGLSAPSCLERIKKLEKIGLIKDYRAILNAQQLGQGLLVFVKVSLAKSADPKNDYVAFESRLAPIPEVLECHMVSGDFDYLLKIRANDIQAYHALLNECVLAHPSVRDSHSYIVLREIKEETGLSLEKIMPADDSAN